MGIESATYISDLNEAWPLGSDLKSTLDNHHRLTKAAIKTTFPNVTGAVTPTHTELNYVDGVTSAIQTQIDAKYDKSGGAITGNTTISGTLGVTGALSGATGAFSGSVTGVTETAGDSSTKYATTAYVQGTAFTAALPAQTGNSGKFVTTDGTNASWSLVPLTTGVSGALPVANGGIGIATAGANVYGPVFAGTTATGAFQVGSPGVANQVLTSNGPSAIPTFQTPAAATVGDHCVSLHTGNGHGSTNNKIRRYTTAMINVGTAMTYADTSADGASITINEAGFYAVSSTDINANTGLYTAGASVNSNQLTTSIESISVANRLMWGSSGGSPYPGAASVVAKLAVNDVVRPHGDGNPSNTTDKVTFTIRKVGNV